MTQPSPPTPPPQPPRWDGALLSGPVHGPIPALLLAMTAATGIVDAVSVLGLGRVFVANMTGNIVFLGFAAAGVPGFALLASLAALLGFLLGALAGGRVVTAHGPRRARLLRNTALVELVLLVAALALLLPVSGQPTTTVAVLVAVVVAAALGLQNSVVRHLAVPDLTTTVLTMTLTGIVADVRTSRRPVVARRLLAVVTMFLGALIGAVLVLSTRLVWALAPAALLLAVVTTVLTVHLRRPAPWQAWG